MRRTLIISEWAPPLAEGATILLGRLLRQLPRGSYSILSRRPEDLLRAPADPSHALDCDQFFFRIFSIPCSGRISAGLNRLLGYLSIPHVVVRSMRLAKRADNILVTSMGTGCIPIAAYFVHLITRKPLFVYLFDAWWELVTSRMDRLIARLFTAVILRSAVHVFVMSETLQDLCQEKFGVDSVMVPHPVDSHRYVEHEPSNKSLGVAQVVFTGAVYSPQLESIRRMASVANSMNGVRFAIYTPRSREELEKSGIGGRNVDYGFVPAEKVASIQMSADILFLPFGFNFANPALIATASPSKMPEYLSAGKPILIHAPAYSYVAIHARKYRFGLVVDEPDEEKLRGALLRLLSDTGLRQELVANARALAKRHDIAVVSAQLKEFLL